MHEEYIVSEYKVFYFKNTPRCIKAYRFVLVYSKESLIHQNQVLCFGIRHVLTVQNTINVLRYGADMPQNTFPSSVGAAVPAMVEVPIHTELWVVDSAL